MDEAMGGLSKTRHIHRSNFTGRLALLDLDQDVLLAILSFCGISGVSSAGQTCRYLHSLTVSRYVWLCLVLDLQSRMFLDVPSGQNLRELSTPELVTLARQTVMGPDSWTPPYSLDRAISRKYLVDTLKPEQEIEAAQPLPGGRYVAITLEEYKLHILDVSENTLVWQYSTPRRLYPQEYKFAVDMLDHGRSAMVLIVEPVLSSEDSRFETVFADFVHLDLVTGTSSSLFNINLGAHVIGWVKGASFLTIRGDIAIVEIRRQLFFINWKTRSCMILDPGVSYAHIILTRHYVVETIETTSDAPRIIIWDIETLTTLCSPDDVPDQWYSGSMMDVPPILSEPIAFPSHPYVTNSVVTTVHESPLHEGLYQVSVVFLAHGKTTISKYSLSTSRVLPSATLCHWRLKSSRTIFDGTEFFYNPPSTSYAGHVVAWVNLDLVVLNLMHWTGRGDAGALVGLHALAEDEDYNSVSISAYSGAVMYATKKVVVIRYYH